MSVEAASLDRQVDRSGDDSSCVLVHELPVATEGSGKHTSRVINMDHEVSANQAQCPSPVSPSHNLLDKISGLQKKLKDRKRKMRALKRKLRRTSKALQAFLD
ncbi:putative zinc finger transcription factor [Colletotrichum sp. SAR11_240]|nr:putative zinc finger transcription factor [Colletotrichum sp. SAR11_240]